MLLAAWNEKLLPFALLGAAIFWPIRRLSLKRWTVRTPVDLPVILLLLALLVSLWATAVPEKTHPQVLRTLTGVALFYALVNSNTIDDHPGSLDDHRLVLITLAGGLILALAAPFIVQWNTLKLPFIPAGLYARFTLLVADPVNQNVLAGCLIVLLPLGLALLLFSWHDLSLIERVLSLSLVVVGGAVLLLTQSRSAWLAFAVAVALLVVLRSHWGWILLIVGILSGIALAVILGFDRFSTLLISNPSLGGMEGRLEVWSRALYMIQDFPFTGIGMGSFTEVADRLYPFFLFMPGSVEHAHNLFLQVAVDLGLPGLIAWLAILFGALFTTWQVFRTGRRLGQSWLVGLGAGLLAAQSALVVHGFTDAVLWGMVRTAPLVWFIWGMAVTKYLEMIHNSAG